MSVDVQIATRAKGVPAEERLAAFAQAALPEPAARLDLTVRIVGRPESARLNRRFRGVDRPTNVLSFPFESPPGLDLPLLGDVVICAPVVAREARRQGKALLAHYAHMVVHGVLHLRGFDHDGDAQAAQMEQLEARLLAALGFSNPYAGEAAPNHLNAEGEGV